MSGKPARVPFFAASITISRYCKIGSMTDDRLATDMAILANGGTYEEKGGHMKKIVLPVVIAAFAASPAAAATKHKKSKEAAEAEDIAKQHDNTWRAVKDALPLVLPS
jgi:hypothetical protein